MLLLGRNSVVIGDRLGVVNMSVSTLSVAIIVQKDQDRTISPFSSLPRSMRYDS
jgi:hypothetical protein